MTQASTAPPGVGFVWTRGHSAALAILCLAQLLEAIDITVVNVALPAIKSDLGFSQSALPWVLNAYNVMFGGFLLLGGRTGDILGRRRLFLIGSIVFTLASLASALAQNPGMLVGSRAVQGLAAGFVSPMTLAIIATVFPEGRPRNRALGIWGTVTGVSASLGLVAGGVLVSGPGWRCIFYINVPVCALLLAAAPRWLPADRPTHRHRRFDVVGAIAVTTGLSLLAYTVVQTGDHPWGSGRTLCLLVISAALLAYFVVHEAFVATEPLVPFTLFRNRSVTGANLLQVLAASSTFAMFYFLSLYEQQVLHYSALKTGLVFVPLTAGIIVFAGLGPVLIPRIGVRFAVIIGAVISTGGLLLFAGISPTGGLVGNIIVPSVIVSGGFAILLIPLTIASVAGVAAEATGVASGLLNTTRQLGGALGLAVIGSITTTRTEGRLHAGQAVESALSDGFRLGFAISAGLMAITVVAALLLLSDQGRGERVNLAELAAAGVRD